MILEQETFEKYGYKPNEIQPHSKKKILILCDYCGNTFNRRNWQVTDGKRFVSKHCCSNPDCHKTKLRETRNKIAIQHHPKIGEKFHYLTMLSKPFKTKKEHCYSANFQCHCGVIKKLTITRVKRGDVRSCGCTHKNCKFKIVHHGQCKTKLYQIWVMLRQRCNNPKIIVFHLYGGKGISVCKEWNESFIIFRDWAMTHGYKEGLSINRIDHNKNYCPENCEWITKSANSAYVTRGRDKEIAELKKRVIELETELSIYKNRTIS